MNLMSSERTKDNNKKHRGLGGWLIIIAINFIFQCIGKLYYSYVLVRQLFFEGYLQKIINYKIELYHTFFILTTNLTRFILAIIVLFLLFSKRKTFPKYLTIFYVFSLIFAIIYIILSIMVGRPDYMNFFASLIAAAIWIPYVFKSKRVKDTFII